MLEARVCRLLQGAAAALLVFLFGPPLVQGRSYETAPQPQPLQLPFVLKRKLADAAAVVAVDRGAIVIEGGPGEQAGSVLFDGLEPPGTVVISGQTNLQPNVTSCWRSCLGMPPCNVVAWCGGQAGCGSTTGPLTFNSCELRHQALSDPDTGRPVLAIEAPGITGGAPIPPGIVSIAPIAGYETFIATSFYNRYNYQCDNSRISEICLLDGTPEDLAPRCTADPQCQAMIYFPFGMDYIGPNLVMFKGGKGVRLDVNSRNYNQNAVTFVKCSVAEESSSHLSAGALAGNAIIVGACALAALMAITGFIAWRRWQRQPWAAARHPARGSSQPNSNQSACSNHSSASGAGNQTSGSTPNESAVPAQQLLASACPSPNGIARTSAGNSLGPRAHSLQAGSMGQPLPVLPSMHTLPGLRRGLSWPGQQATPQMRALQQHSAPAAVAAGAEFLHVGQGNTTGSLGDEVLQSGKEEECIKGERGMGSDGASGSLGLPASSALLDRLPEDRWQEWVVTYDRIHFCKTLEGTLVELGRGSFGTVYKVLLDGVQPLAAKVIYLGSNAEQQRRFLQEATMLRRLRHKHIVGFAGVCVQEEQGQGILLMELMEARDLHSLLVARNKSTGERTLGWYNRGKRIALDVALALHHLHTLNIAHFDVKLSNVLLSRDLTAKLADVGFTSLRSSTHHSISGNCGTFDYMAPEILVGHTCTESVDIFSFGVLLWAICSGEHPLRGRNRLLSVPDEAPQGVVDLINECAALEPAARPTAKQLVQRLSDLSG